jgi:hypothetical protein
MRTSARLVDPGRLGRSAADCNPFRPLMVDSVAVLLCCTAFAGQRRLSLLVRYSRASSAYFSVVFGAGLGPTTSVSQ